MEILSLKPYFTVSSSLLYQNPSFGKSNLIFPKPYSIPYSKRALTVSVSSSNPGINTPSETLETQSGVSSPPFTPLCLLFALVHSLGGFVRSRAPKLRAWLCGGRADGGGDEYALSGGGGGIGVMLMSTTTAAAAAASASKSRVSPHLWALAGNPTFVSGLVAWALAQTMKLFLNFFVERRWDLAMLFSCGGMPSSHSALCMALTTSVALCHGVGDSLFPVCLGFSLIVMYDAIGVRRHAGIQAEVSSSLLSSFLIAALISF